MMSRQPGAKKSPPNRAGAFLRPLYPVDPERRQPFALAFVRDAVAVNPPMHSSIGDPEVPGRRLLAPALSHKLRQSHTPPRGDPAARHGPAIRSGAADSGAQNPAARNSSGNARAARHISQSSSNHGPPG